MANATADRDDCRREGAIILVPTGSNTIYAGTLVTVDASGNGKAGEANKPFLGVALEGTGDVDEAKIRVWVEGTFEFDMSSAAATDLGKHVIVSDDHTVAAATEVSSLASTTLTAATAYNQIVGKIVEVVDTTNGKVRVKLGF